MELRDYQEEISTEAAKLLEWAKIAYLALEVRVGKTVTALATAKKYGATSVLFVTKKMAIGSIEKDYKAYNPGFALTVINYEQLHNLETSFDLIIIDEAHSIGQYPIRARRTNLLKKICAEKPIIYLSGTPTPEAYTQIYHQLWVSSFSPFKAYINFYKWAKEFVHIKKKYLYGRELNDYSNANKAKIEEHIKHLFITYTQGDAGFGQQIKEEVIKVRMRPVTYKVANNLIANRVVIGKRGNELVADTEVKLMQKLHQIYSGTVKDETGQALCFDNSKVDFIAHHFRGKRIAIFYKFVAEGQMLAQQFGDRVTTSPEEFNCSEDKIFISQIQSGREGINLSTADCIVMLNIDFSAVSYMQARARLQSKERVKEAKIFWVFSEGGIEDKIYKAVIGKQDYTLSWFRKDFLPEVMKKSA
jgi:superfamily II DNA or RNA helicase